MIKDHADLKFMHILCKLKPHQFSTLLPLLNDDAIEIICSFLNYLLNNPKEPKFKNRRKLKQLILDNQVTVEKIANDNTAGRFFKKKRRIIKGGFAGTLLSILASSIPALLSLTKS